MKERTHGNALLLELLIAIAFFLLAAAVLLQVYGAANALSLRAARITAALDGAQNAADAVIASASPEETLAQMGFVPENGGWTRDDAGIRLSVSIREEARAAGILLTGEARAETAEGDELLTLPIARYRGAAYE